MALIDFTLSNARRFYSSMGNPSGLKGLKTTLSFLNAAGLDAELNLWEFERMWRDQQARQANNIIPERIPDTLKLVNKQAFCEYIFTITNSGYWVEFKLLYSIHTHATTTFPGE